MNCSCACHRAEKFCKNCQPSAWDVRAKKKICKVEASFCSTARRHKWGKIRKKVDANGLLLKRELTCLYCGIYLIEERVFSNRGFWISRKMAR